MQGFPLEVVEPIHFNAQPYWRCDMLKKSLVVLWLILALLSVHSDATAQTGRYKLSIVLSELSPWYEGAALFADLVKARTDGKVLIDIYPNQQLSSGDLVKGLQMLQAGAIDMAFSSTIHYAAVDPRFMVVSMPWIMPGYDAVDRIVDGPLGEQLMDMVRDNKVEPLALAGDGFRQITNNVREIKKPEDLKGLRIRIPGMKMYVSTFKHLGANAAALDFAELYSALQQKTMDGQENPVSTIVSGKLHEVQKYCTLWNYSYHLIVIGVNKKVWDGFDDKTKEILKKSAKQAAFYEKMVARKMDKDLVETMIGKGVKVTQLSPEQIKPFLPLVDPIYTEMEPTIGKELLAKFRSESLK
jgi:tripartite ATP-independent transporter DctP family solute receptor